MRIGRWYHSNGRKQRGTKQPLDECKKGEWKSWLKLNIQTTKIISSGPIISWWIEGEKVEAVTDFLFLGFKITTDGDCSHEIRRCLLLGRKAMTNLDSILKSKDITLPTKDHIIKAMDFLVVMYRCEGPQRRLNAKELMLSNCGAGEDSWEALWHQEGQPS